MVSRVAFVAEARSWMGTPFHHQAAVRAVGCDCIGLIAGVARAFALPDAQRFFDSPSLRNYSRQPNPDLLRAGCADLLVAIEINAAALGDILVMRFLRFPQHFAILSATDPRYIIHAHERAGRVVEHRLDDTWSRRVLRAYRLRGID